MLLSNNEKDKNIELIWIPAHRNIQGNDNADVLGKRDRL